MNGAKETDRNVNPYDPPESQSNAGDSTMEGQAESVLWSFEKQPLAWQVASVIGILFGFGGVFFIKRFVSVGPTVMWLMLGGWMSLCLVPASFFLPPRYRDRPARNWLHAFSPSLVIFVWCAISAIAQYWGGDSLQRIFFILATLGFTLIAAKRARHREP